MSYKRVPRLYVKEKLNYKSRIIISGSNKHYLEKVLRLKANDLVVLYNGLEGEWEAKIIKEKNIVLMMCIKKIKEQLFTNGPALYFPVLRPSNIRFIIEKATELGVSMLQPIITKHTNKRNINYSKLITYAREASQISERMDIPKIYKSVTIREGIKQIEKNDKILIFCDENRDSDPLKIALENYKKNDICFIIGPEGGFSDSERNLLLSSKKVIPVHLGSRILKSETAVIAALSAFKLL